MPDRPSVAIGLWLAVGGRHEQPSENGAAHFIEHMLFKGTRKRSAREISEAVEGVGGYLNAFTGEESTCFYARARHDHFEVLFDVLSDMLLHSRFHGADLTKEREVIKEEIAMYLDQPHQHVLELSNEQLWPGQSLGRPLAGTPQTLDGLNRRGLLQFFERRYTSDALVVSAAGQVRHEHVVRATRLLANHLPRSKRGEFEPASSRQTRPECLLVSKSTEQTQLALAFRAYSRHDPRRFALRFLSVVLGENMSSRLFQVIREDHGLAYSIGSSVSSFHDTGALLITAGLDDRNLPRVLRLALREVARLRSERISPAALRRARDYILGQFHLGLESTENQMNWLGEQMLGHGRILPVSDIERKVMAVTAAEVRTVAQDVFQPIHANLALVSPLKRVSALERELNRGL